VAAPHTRWSTRHSCDHCITVAFCIGYRHSFSVGYRYSFSIRRRFSIGCSYSFAGGFPNSVTSSSCSRCDLTGCNAVAVSNCFVK
jgi:hypothetical protein